MNHFLNSSVIIPNNDINIITTAQIQTITPKIVKVYVSFIPPKWISIGPINIGINDEINSFIWLAIFLFIYFLKFSIAVLIFLYSSINFFAVSVSISRIVFKILTALS